MRFAINEDLYTSGLYGFKRWMLASSFNCMIRLFMPYVKANWSYPRAIMFGLYFLIAKYLSFSSPSTILSINSVFLRFLMRWLSLLIVARPFIFFTVESRAITAIMYPPSSRACLNMFSCPACRMSKVPKTITFLICVIS